MSGEKIQVREGWWRQRCGNVVHIAGESGDAYYPWRCVTGRVYRKDGKFFTHKETELDLVEYLGKNITITAADIDIPELRVPVVFWACTDCPGSTTTWHWGPATPKSGVATCDSCGRSSTD